MAVVLLVEAPVSGTPWWEQRCTVETEIFNKLHKISKKK
jgi:hypothetical protein